GFGAPAHAGGGRHDTRSPSVGLVRPAPTPATMLAILRRGRPLGPGPAARSHTAGALHHPSGAPTPMRSLLAALLLSTVSVAQTVYYVDAVNGNDLNPGTTRVQAFRSISFASSFLADDDTLIILPGIYSPTLTGELFPIKLGELTSQRRIDILCEGGPQTTILDGEQQATSSLIPLMRFFGQAEGARLRGLQFTNTG